MPSIQETFDRLGHKPALIPFLTAGDPDLVTTGAALLTLARHGADILEVGVPYADPLADGPVIQAAATRARQRGTTLSQVLELLAGLIPALGVPVVLFSYYNPVLAMGAENFMARLHQAGVKGVVIPDLPLEEAGPLLTLGAAYGVDVILLIAPTSPPDRIARIVQAAQGFVYVVSLTGTTGVQQQLATNLPQMIQQVRALTTKPIAVGFGISTPAQARQVADWGANGVIVGSACVQLLAQTPEPERLARLGEFCQQLRDALG
ncbi:tryptophan synthase subunit alpha [Candidatus Cyanaurora vandensis]|uniref:tryptophan synthase subunit alpha n=1 Tax=Candidatus Cyanaurora vandensis TaxID=2714958 RepID=UPI0037C00627